MGNNSTLANRLISGTFIQPDHWCDLEGERFQKELRAMSPEHWEQMLEDMSNIGIDTLIFQQGVDCRKGWDNPQAYYPSKYWKSPKWLHADNYSAIVDAADKIGMKIYHSIGTMFTKDPYLETTKVLKMTKIMINELLELYGDRPSFSGWYWPHEYPPSTVAGRESLKRMVPEIRKFCDCDLLIAPNADRGVTSSELHDIDIDIIAYQDTVGLGVAPDKFGRFAMADRHDSLHRLPYMFQRLKFAHDGWHASSETEMDYWNYYTRKRGRTAIWNDLEIWEFDSHGRLFPTELSRIVAQLDLTAPYVEKQIIYQYPGLMCHPDHSLHVGGERAATLYEDYARYRESLLKKEELHA